MEYAQRLNETGGRFSDVAIQETMEVQALIEQLRGEGLSEETQKTASYYDLKYADGASLIPVVRETGGLKDTIHQYDKYSETGNGFVFSNYNAHEMMYALKKALGAYSDFMDWENLIRNAMTSDYSWKGSAKEYVKLYEKLLAK